GLTALSAEFTIGEGELMAHDVPLGCAPDEYDDLISGTCSHLPQLSRLIDSLYGKIRLHCELGECYKGDKQLRVTVLASPVLHSEVSWCRERFLSCYSPHSH
ncbi:hypothetical protein ACN6NP_28075, partial [Klebsiella pneumoniae]